MDAEASEIGDTDINLTIEATETPQRGIDRVVSIGSSHDDDIGTSFDSIHKGKQLRDDTSFDFSVNLSVQ